MEAGGWVLQYSNVKRYCNGGIDEGAQQWYGRKDSSLWKLKINKKLQQGLDALRYAAIKGVQYTKSLSLQYFIDQISVLIFDAFPNPARNFPNFLIFP